jgi:hypothetical protein
VLKYWHGQDHLEKMLEKWERGMQVLLGQYESKLKILEALQKIFEAKCEIIKSQKSQNKSIH